MSIPQASLLSQITGITFAGEDDPRLQTHAKDLCDDFRLDALRLEAAAEARLSEEVGKCILSLAQQNSANPWSHRCTRLMLQQIESVSNSVRRWSRSIIITVF
jgi:hypothetical protein